MDSKENYPIYKARSHAKVNLRLKVVGRRADGYHLLSMINGQIELSDLISFVPGNGEVIVSIPSYQSLEGSRNTILRASEAFDRIFGVTTAGKFLLEKNIPVEGGLGGGSADAAAALNILVAVHAEKLGQIYSAPEIVSILQTVALSVGADVHYALIGGLCLVEGIGEQISPLQWVDSSTSIPLILILPPFGSSTPEVFSTYRKNHPELVTKPEIAFKEIGFTWQKLAGFVENDLEEIVSSAHPLIGQVLKFRDTFPALSVGMTGSGSTLFGWDPEGNTDNLREFERHLTRNYPMLKTISSRLMVSALPVRNQIKQEGVES